MLYFFCYKAGKKTTDEELEEMLESGNPAIFTSGVSDSASVDTLGGGQVQLMTGREQHEGCAGALCS